MPDDPPGQRQAGSHEEGRPVDGVELQNVLSHQVDIGGPVAVVEGTVARVIQGRDVVGQGVEPDVENVLGIGREGDPPTERGPADAQVPEPGGDEGDDLIAPGLREDEFGVGPVVFEQGALVLGEAEKVALLRDALHRVPLVGALSVHQLRLGEKGLAPGAVPAFVSPLDDVSAGEDPLEDPEDTLLVAMLRGADEIIVGDPEPLPERVVALDHLIGQSDGGHPPPGRGALDLLPVLIGSGEKVNVVPKHPVEARQNVGHHGRVGVADVGNVVDVVDGSRDVELAHERWTASAATRCTSRSGTPAFWAAWRQSSYSGVAWTTLP